MSVESESESTTSDRRANKFSLDCETERLYPELDTISIPDDLDKFGEVEFMKSLRDEPDSGRKGKVLKAGEKRKYIRRVNEEARDLFGTLPSFRSSSSVIIKGLDWDTFNNPVDFKAGYEHRVPLVGEKIYEMPEFGCYGVPLLYFDYGMRLPLHPFFFEVYDVLDCGFGQLTPNSVAHICGVIARCAEKGMKPSLSILFSIYAARFSNGQVHLDKIRGGVALVNVPSSNHTWHPDFTFLIGEVLDRVGPWRSVSNDRLKELSVLGTMPAAEKKRFCGLYPQYEYKRFRDVEFLESHNLAGNSLLRVIHESTMISEKTKLLLMKRRNNVVPVPKHDGETVPGVKDGRDDANSSSPTRPEGVKLAERQERLDDEVNKDRPRTRHGKDGNPSKKHKGEVPTFVSKDSLMEQMLPLKHHEEGGVNVNVTCKETWVIGEDHIPFQTFQVFNLPQDHEHYAKMTREELGKRSLIHLGKFVSDFTQMLGDYRSDPEPRRREKATKEITELKKKVSLVEEEVERARQGERKALDEVGSLKKSYGEESVVFQERIDKLENELSGLKLIMTNLEKEKEENALSLKSFRGQEEKNTKLISELKESLAASETEAAQNVEVGYNYCYARMKEVGLPPGKHTFEDYLVDLEAEEKAKKAA